jgi:hypothetical protein
LFAALEVAMGKVHGSLHRRHRAEEFEKFLVKLDREVPEGLNWTTTPRTRPRPSGPGSWHTPASDASDILERLAETNSDSED